MIEIIEALLMDCMDDKGDGSTTTFGSSSKDDNDVDENFS